MNVAVKIPGSAWRDDFATERGGWLTGPAYDYDPIGVDSGALRDLDPYARRGVSTSPPFEPEVPPEDAVHPPVDGMIHPGIGWAGRRMPDGYQPDVEVTWAGLWDIHEGHHIEATPLLWIDPTNPLGGLGCWPITIGYDDESPGIPVGMVGFIGSPPELFATASAPTLGSFAFSHTDETPRRIRIRLTDADAVEVLIDDVSVWSRSLSHSSFTSLATFDDLMESNLHGVALDAHLVRPVSQIPDLDGALDVTFHGYVP